jgi:hypothetical protein
MRRLCIVANGAPMLYGYLIVALERDREGPDPIEIVVDRRRAASGAPAVERRKPSAVDLELETRGFVVLDENGDIVRDAERPEERLPAWKARSLQALERIEAAWRSVQTAWRSWPAARPALPSLARARDGLAIARQQSLSTVFRAREGLQSTWQALAAAGAPAPRERRRLPQRPRMLWMLGGAVTAVAAAAAFLALEPPDPPNPAAARDARSSTPTPAVTIAAVDGPRAVPSPPNGSPPPANGTPSPAVVPAPTVVPAAPTVVPSAAVETPAPEAAAARPEPANDRAALAPREAPASSAAATARETSAPARAATAPRETPASPQTAVLREAPPPRHAAAARSEEPPDARPSGPPKVELQSDVAGRADERTITYTARLSDARGRPLVNAEVSLHGWLPDGSDLKARLTSTATPGVYRASVPVGARTPSNLRVLVALGGKRFEVAPQHRAL